MCREGICRDFDNTGKKGRPKRRVIAAWDATRSEVRFGYFGKNDQEYESLRTGLLLEYKRKYIKCWISKGPDEG